MQEYSKARIQKQFLEWYSVCYQQNAATSRNYYLPRNALWHQQQWNIYASVRLGEGKLSGLDKLISMLVQSWAFLMDLGPACMLRSGLSWTTSSPASKSKEQTVPLRPRLEQAPPLERNSIFCQLVQVGSQNLAQQAIRCPLVCVYSISHLASRPSSCLLDVLTPWRQEVNYQPRTLGKISSGKL